MDIIQEITDWWQAKKQAHHQKREAMRNKRAQRNSCESINVMEFNGDLYVSYEGVPVVPISKINVKVEALLTESRIAYLSWKKTFDPDGYGR